MEIKLGVFDWAFSGDIQRVWTLPELFAVETSNTGTEFGCARLEFGIEVGGGGEEEEEMTPTEHGGEERGRDTLGIERIIGQAECREMLSEGVV